MARHFDLPEVGGVWIATLLLRSRLSHAVRSWAPERIVPLDEVSALVLRTLATDQRVDAQVRAVLTQSFGSPAGYHAACHRLSLMRVAATLSVRTPDFGGARDTLGFPVLVKRDHSSGSGGVTIVGAKPDLASALRRAVWKQRIKRVLARGVGYEHGADPILLQRFVPGTLAMRTVVAQNGRTVDGISLLATRSHPEKRASTVLEPLDCLEMEDAARRLVAALGCSGFVSFDFIVDPQGAAFLIEMNPRPIGSTHLGRLFGHDLAHTFLTAQVRDVPDFAGIPAARAVALFPKELERDPTGSSLDAAPDLRHDVPWAEPKVVAAYSAHLQRIHPAHAASLRRRCNQIEPPADAGVLRAPSRFSQASP